MRTPHAGIGGVCALVRRLQLFSTVRFEDGPRDLFVLCLVWHTEPGFAEPVALSNHPHKRLLAILSPEPTHHERAMIGERL
jgi:hypothetical protein